MALDAMNRVSTVGKSLNAGLLLDAIVSNLIYVKDINNVETRFIASKAGKALNAMLLLDAMNRVSTVGKSLNAGLLLDAIVSNLI